MRSAASLDATDASDWALRKAASIQFRNGTPMRGRTRRKPTRSRGRFCSAPPHVNSVRRPRGSRMPRLNELWPCWTGEMFLSRARTLPCRRAPAWLCIQHRDVPWAPPRDTDSDIADVAPLQESESASVIPSRVAAEWSRLAKSDQKTTGPPAVSPRSSLLNAIHRSTSSTHHPHRIDDCSCHTSPLGPFPDDSPQLK